MALDGRSRLVFPHPDEANDPRGARTDDFKDDDRLVDDRCGAVKGGTKDHAVGIAAMARGDPKLEVTAEEPARLAAERRPVKAKARFRWITAWANVPPVIATGPTSFLAQALRILPSEEFSERRGFTNRLYHDLATHATNGAERRRRPTGQNRVLRDVAVSSRSRRARRGSFLSRQTARSTRPCRPRPATPR
jgi:hypothetical protein